MSYLDIVEKYLHDHKFFYERIDNERRVEIGTQIINMDRHQIIVYDSDVTGMSEDEKRDHYIWDVICHYGSYGYERGLLEGMGNMFSEYDVMGYMTAWDVIDFIEGRREPDSLE